MALKKKLVTGVIVITLLMGGLQYFTLLMGGLFHPTYGRVVSPPFKKGPTSQDTIKMLDSDTSLDLFRKRSTALLQFSSHEKVKKAPFLTSIFWRLTGLSTFVGCNDRVLLWLFFLFFCRS